MAIETRHNAAGKEIYYVSLRNPHTGKIVRECAGPSKSIAKQLETKRKNEFRESKLFGRKNEITTLTFGALTDRYLTFQTGIKNTQEREEMLRQINRKEREPFNKKSAGKDMNQLKHILPYFGNQLAAHITPGDIERYRNTRKKEISTRTHKFPSTATINLELNCMSAIFTWAVRKEKILAENPLSDITREKTHNERNRVLTQDEYDRLIKQLAPHIQPIFITAMNTGMRTSEILNLTWPKVDLQTGMITLQPQDTKTGEGRIIPLNSILGDLFNQLEKNRVPGCPYVFTFKGQRIKSIKKAFLRACQRAGIHDFRFHDTRHCFITRAVSENKPILLIRKVTGHKTMKSFERYNNPVPDQLRSIVEPLLT